MRQLMNGFLYEHPVHSLILDPSDMIWNGRFSADELDEIKTHKLKPLSHLPNDLMECLDKYDKKWANALDAKFEKKWIKESMMRTAELSLDGKILNLENYSESDLLHGVWPMLGERCSVAVAFRRNEERGLEAVESDQGRQWRQSYLKTSRDVLSILIQKAPAKVNDLTTTSVTELKLILMGIPVGQSITRIMKTPKLGFPSSFETFAADLISILEAT
ncbi:hypothetical protein BC941DRAFT_463710 [Chlamydoabsidia padenii]|nr:hypothetical protein BC941DRAFT_463710 [Chlamydoabsidia padenii]